MIKRDAEPILVKLASQFKAVAVVGPRQSGKTTLVKYVFDQKPYVNLENPDMRRFAHDDPRGFLAQYPDGAILDEAQRVPDLFSYLQEILDNNSKTGLFIITGSNNFLLQEKVSQSLAGRVAYLYLLPFSLNELTDTGLNDVYHYIYKGSYPPLYDQPVEPDKWYLNYIRTYVERDVRQLKNISDLNIFDRFLRLCAARTGQLLNMNNLAMETGVDIKTIGSWLGILENSFIIYRLQPHHINYNKRVVKMPKLYFYDTGIVCSLLGIQNTQQLIYHPHTGSLFENMVINELMKHRFNEAMKSNLFFWRDSLGHEVDVVIERQNDLFSIELKSGKTITADFFKGLEKWFEISGNKSGAIVYAGDIHQKRSNGINVVPWNAMERIFLEISA